MDRPSITVVLPTRDRSALLREALGSLLHQDLGAERYEIVVVDDGSTDETTEVVTGIAEADGHPRIRLHRQAASGQNAARNRGVRQAEAPLIAFFDDDELAPPSWLSNLVAGADRHPEALCVGGAYRLRFEGRPPRMCSRCWPGEGTFDRGPDERPVANVPGGNMAVRREAFEAVGPFDESLVGYGNETEWMMRLIEAGGTIVHLPPAWVWHRRTAEQLRLSSLIRKSFDLGRQDARFQARSAGAWERVARSYGMPAGRRSAAWVPRLLGHAAWRRCTGGLTRAAAALGFAVEELRSRRGGAE
jgi:glycosyltransferase involved in cell wall biosynthesis